MNLENAGYSENRIITELSRSNRNVWYEYSVQNSKGNTIGFLSIENAVLSFDSNNTVMRTLKGTVKRSYLMNIDTLDNRIVPWFCIKFSNGDIVKWQLGVFLIDPSESCEDGTSEVSLTGFDLGKIAYDDKITSRLYIQRGSIYTSWASQVIGVDYTNIDVKSSYLTKNADEEWEIGSRRIDISNDLLKAINYNPIHFDEHGKCIIDSYSLPQLRPVEFQYKSDNMSIILDGVSKTSNKFDIPNKFVRYVENVDAEYYISTYENRDDKSPFSIQNRGRTIVSTASVKDIATQAELDAYTIKCAAETMQKTDKITFRTLPMPGHGFKNCLYINIPIYGIDDKYIETSWEMELKPGGTMKHICERVISV